MCAVWQSIGLWMFALVCFLVGLATGLPGGWHAHSVHGWGKRMHVHARHLAPAIKLGGYALGGVAILGIFAYGWLVR